MHTYVYTHTAPSKAEYAWHTEAYLPVQHFKEGPAREYLRGNAHKQNVSDLRSELYLQSAVCYLRLEGQACNQVPQAAAKQSGTNHSSKVKIG
jgi:hypothetical protein